MIFKRKNKKLSSAPRQYRAHNREKQPVFSYRSSRSDLERPYDRGQSEEDIKQSLNILTHLQYAATALVVLVGLIYLLSLSSDAQIKVSGQQTLPRESSTYENAVETKLKSNLLNRFKLTLNSAGIAADLRSQFPEIQYVEVKTSLFRHRPQVNVQLSSPAARLVTPSATYVLDSQGRALFDAYDQKTSFDVSSLTAINDTSGQPIEVGKPALTEQQISYVVEVLGQLSKKNLKIQEMSLANGGLELHVRLSGSPYFIKFAFVSDARQSSGAYLAIRDQSIPINEYVDVRIPDRAYVK